MIVYTGTFTKADGTARTMHFARLTDLPDTFLATQVKGEDLTEARIKAKAKMTAEGKETVWDLEANNFRVFNWNTTVDDVCEEEIEELNYFKNNA